MISGSLLRLGDGVGVYILLGSWCWISGVLESLAWPLLGATSSCVFGWVRSDLIWGSPLMWCYVWQADFSCFLIQEMSLVEIKNALGAGTSVFDLRIF